MRSVGLHSTPGREKEGKDWVWVGGVEYYFTAKAQLHKENLDDFGIGIYTHK